MASHFFWHTVNFQPSTPKISKTTDQTSVWVQMSSLRVALGLNSTKPTTVSRLVHREAIPYCPAPERWGREQGWGLAGLGQVTSHGQSCGQSCRPTSTLQRQRHRRPHCKTLLTSDNPHGLHRHCQTLLFTSSLST